MDISICGTEDEAKGFKQLLERLEDSGILLICDTSKTYRERGIPRELSLNRLRFVVELKA